MAIPLYLAMTAREFRICKTVPANMAWMACHFSPYGTGLSNLPTSLPPGSMIILNDRTPICGHDPELIAAQLKELLEKLHASCILLDLQRPGSSETANLVRMLVGNLSCTVGVSELYAEDLPCPVFVSSPKPNTALKEHLAPWDGREIWLEAALDRCCLTVTEKGCEHSVCDGVSEFPFHDSVLHCHYAVEAEETSVRFHLCRSKEDLSELLEEAAACGVTHAAGLWQELQ